MTDREALIEISRICAQQLLGTTPPPGPIDPPPPPPPPPPNTSPTEGPVYDLGWSSGNPQIATAGIQTYTIEPSAEWLARPPQTRYLSIAGGYTSVGMTPPYVSYTIGATTVVFNGSNQSWDTYMRDFPQVFGPFAVIVKLLDGNKQPLGAGYAASVQLNHN